MLFNKKCTEHLDHEPSTNQPTVNAPAARASRPGPRSPGNATTRSVVDPWLHITGNLEGDGELQIDGHLRGDVRCTHLIVGNHATIDGNITADQIVVRGKVKGNIRANYVMLQLGAHVESDIFHKELAIEAGAHFEGTSRCRENPVAETQAAAEQPKPAETAKTSASPTESEGAAVEARAETQVGEPIEANPPADAMKPPQATRSTRQVATELERLRAHLR